MDLAYSTEQELFRRTITEFVEQQVTPRVAQMEKEHAIPEELYRAIADMGFYGLRYPEDIGGQGGDNILFAILLEELARGYLSVAAATMMQCLMGTEFLHRCGTDEQKERLLYPALRGEKYGAICMTEPLGGTDLGAIATTAVRQGDTYTLEGSKSWITGADRADYFTVAAKTDPQAGFKGIDLFLVEADNPGLEVGSEIPKLSAWGVHCYEVNLRDVKVPVENLFGGQEGQGFPLLRGVLNDIRVHTGALALGVARAALEDAKSYAQQRQAFGRPIVKFQAMAHKLAKMAIDIENSRLLIYQGAWRMDQGLPVNRESAMAKYVATETAIDCAEQAGRIFGALGTSLELGPQRYLRDARWFLYGGGTQTINLDIIARELQK